MARAAGRIAGRMMRGAAPVAAQSTRVAKDWMPTARQSGQFVKHVVPAAVKPLHSLWHEIIGFIFLAVAGSGAWKIYRHSGTISPVMLALAVVLIGVTAGYGISSIRKSRKISRS